MRNNYEEMVGVKDSEVTGNKQDERLMYNERCHELLLGTTVD